MNRTFRLLSCAAVAIAALTSCAKEQFKENAIPAGEKIQVSINGQIGEFTPADATKATAESVVRVTWGEGDKVYVYDGSNASIGTLTVTPDNNNASYAMLSGTITASSASPAPTKLTLVYVKGATEAPAIAGGKISVDLSSQNQTEVPFVLYTTVDYNAAALTKTNEYISFDFATSVMTVNCTGLQTGASGAIAGIDKAEIDGVSTACELTVTGSGVAVAGAKTGKITRTDTAEPSVFTQSDSRGSFRLALASDPADPAAPAARNILVHQGSKVSGAAFTPTTLATGKSYNTVYQMGEYVSNGAGGYAPTVKVTGVSLNKTKTTIEPGATERLEATVAPADATNKQITWSSSDTSVATVDANSGEVTGVAEGSAVITATTADGNFTAVCLVTVTAIPVSSVSLNKTELTLTVGADVQLIATVAPENATNKNVTWTSNNESIATVDNTGKVTAVSAGTANITVTTVDGSKTATCEVTVSNPVVNVTGVTLNKDTLNLAVGGNETLIPMVSPTNATNKQVNWSSSDTSVATVDANSGEVTGVAPGSAGITATTADGNFTAVCLVTVTAVPVSSVSLNKTELTLTVGADVQLIATVAPENATNKAVSWSSDKTSVATVNDQGYVHAVAQGTANITVTTTDGQKTAVCEVTVKGANAEELSGNEFDWGGSGGSTEPMTGSNYDW